MRQEARDQEEREQRRSTGNGEDGLDGGGGPGGGAALGGELTVVVVHRAVRVEVFFTAGYERCTLLSAGLQAPHEQEGPSRPALLG